ncbi:MAG: GNAT family N-acetyltransferase [Clostridiales bacterium]|nr:GNAT family N-acetyltransferase [Clostridiales bacterium]
MKYQKAELTDLDNIYELVQKTIRTIYPRYYLKEIVDMFTEFHSKESIAKDIEQGKSYLLKLDDDTIIGTGTASENHITRVYVLPEYQGQGSGTYIMQQLEATIAEKYSKAEIDASLPACKLYAKLGYKTVNHGIWNCANDVIQVYEIMEKDLRDDVITNLRLRPYKTYDRNGGVSMNHLENYYSNYDEEGRLLSNHG